MKTSDKYVHIQIYPSVIWCLEKMQQRLANEVILIN